MPSEYRGEQWNIEYAFCVFSCVLVANQSERSEDENP